MSQNPLNRVIYWILDFRGKTGKSSFVNYHAFHSNGLILTWDDPRDVLHIRSTNLDKKLIFCDFTRSVPLKVDMNNFYSTIESVKNGCFVTTKYESKQLFTSVPHVFVFANFLPNFSSLSSDRWRLLRITEDYNLILMDASSLKALEYAIDIYKEKSVSIESPLVKRKMLVLLSLDEEKELSYEALKEKLSKLSPAETLKLSERAFKSLNLKPTMSNFKLPDWYKKRYDLETLPYNMLLGEYSGLEQNVISVPLALSDYLFSDDVVPAEDEYVE